MELGFVTISKIGVAVDGWSCLFFRVSYHKLASWVKRRSLFTGWYRQGRGSSFSEHKAQRLAFSDGFKPVRLGQVAWDGQEGWFDLLVIDMVMDRLVRCSFCRPEVNHRKKLEVFWNCFNLKTGHTRQEGCLGRSGPVTPGLVRSGRQAYTDV